MAIYQDQKELKKNIYQALNGPGVPRLVRGVDERVDGAAEAQRVQQVGQVRHRDGVYLFRLLLAGRHVGVETDLRDGEECRPEIDPDLEGDGDLPELDDGGDSGRNQDLYYKNKPG